MVGTHSSPRRELHVALLGLLELGLISSPQLPPCPYNPKSPEALEVPCQLLGTTYFPVPRQCPQQGSRFLMERWEQPQCPPHDIVTRKQHSEEEPGAHQPQIRPAEHLSPPSEPPTSAFPMHPASPTHTSDPYCFHG